MILPVGIIKSITSEVSDPAQKDAISPRMTDFGPTLRDWRKTRRMSQLDLGLSANVSARHISFLETGRARPSREMVLHLAAALDVPRPARNSMLTHAGFAAPYRARDAADADLAEIHNAIRWTIERHSPYPAMVLDRDWHLVDANPVAMMLLSGLGIARGTSVLAPLKDPARAAEIFENWGEVGRLTALRLRAESAHAGGIAELDAFATLIEADPAVTATPIPAVQPAVIPAIYRAGPLRLSLFSTIAQFGTVEDIALSDIRIELMFPADAATRAWLEAQNPPAA